MHIPIPTMKSVICSTMVLAGSASAEVQPDFGENRVSAMVVQTSGPSPSSSFYLAIELSIDEGWHTYWPGINDTGYGVSLSFDPVQGLRFGEPRFPTPHRHIAPGRILDHIYEDSMVIYVPVELDDSFTPGDSISISSTIDYLVCQEYCVPESIDLTHEFVVQEFNPVNQVKSDTLEFPMILNDASYTSIDTKPTAVINGTEVEIIVCGNDSLTKRWSEESVELSMLDATHYTFFPDNNCTQPADLITQGDVESDTLTITFDRQYEEDPATPARLSGRLLVKQSNGWVREYDIDFTEPQSQEIQP